MVLNQEGDMRKMLFAGAVLALLGSSTATAYAAGMTWGAMHVS